MDRVEVVRKKYAAVKDTLSERGRRLWAGAEADSLGRSGVRVVASATQLAISTVWKGREEVRNPPAHTIVKDRRPGAGRPRVETKHPRLKETLEHIVSATVRGDPESPLRWSLKSVRQLAAELKAAGMSASPQKVGELLHEMDFSLQGTSRVKEGAQHPERDAQFNHINERTKELQAQGEPVISVDTKKKESVGNYARPGREWHRKGEPPEVNTYEFLQRGDSMAIPYGVYDLKANSGFINVGIDHDTPRFAVASIDKWWTTVGHTRYPDATRIFITADSGGSNSAVSRVWKEQLQDFADRTSLVVEVSHFPAGTSKWNKIEHRLFSFVSLNWRGHPLFDYQTVLSLIGLSPPTSR